MASARGWAAVLLMLALGGCSGVPDPRQSSSPVAASAGFGDAPPVSSSAPVAAPAEVSQAGFTSPSGNIGCYVDKDAARCDIVKRSWKPPARPADCDLDWASGISVYQAEEAAFTCAGDTVLGSKETLSYGSSVRAGDFTCSSDSKAMRCENTASGHGFTLSVERYDVF